MTRQFPKLLALLILGFAIAYEVPHGVRAAGQPLVVIAGAGMPIKDISLATLRRAFQGEPTDYSSGKRFIAINLPPNSPERTTFDRVVLGLKPDEVGRFWIDRRIRDQSGPPKTVPSVDLVLRLVMSLPGAVGYVQANMLNPKVQALTIDGKSPGQKGYPLE